MENIKSLSVIKNLDPLLPFQPDKDFTDILCAPVHSERPAGFTRRKARDGEAYFKRVTLDFNFPDPKNLLQRAYADFKKFLKSANIKRVNNGKIITTEFVDFGDNVEKFLLSVTQDKCVIKTGATEGVRRALIFIEDEMKRRCGPLLPLGETVREPFVKTRISRCFFTPPSHASSEGLKNELASKVDYYPEEYLNRLAHDGINGLWIGTTFRKLLKSRFIKQYGSEQTVQIKKLNKIIARCKKYGIDIYLFVTEPASSNGNDDVLNNPDLLGEEVWNIRPVCPSSKTTQAYIEEAVTNLFTLAPDLAGLINITVGESLSNCGSIPGEFVCPACKEKYGSWQATLTATEKMFSDAMKKVAPKAKFISWPYAQRSWPINDTLLACELRDKNVIHMQNFEDWGRPVQLGRKRLAFDYWLSYVGPGDLMAKNVKVNKTRGVETFAKIQVCSSHEISTVPYVPVPGLLYDKYKYFHENGITGVLQCWYFGNYPSMMNKGASELSYAPLFDTKDEFLIHLAKTYFGKDYKRVVKAWKLFEKGYKNFPVSVSFEWVGPMQDSPCCPLHLLPADWPMPATWLNYEMSGGDRIGECLLNGHTIDEALVLVGRMNEYWNEGLDYIKDIKDSGNYSKSEQLDNAKAIGLIFNSGYNVLKFYKLRHLLGTQQGNPFEILKNLKDIVLEEIKISKALLPISIKDKRIGYHSEAYGYKIFPKKIEWRIGELEKLLQTEFPLVEKRLNDGLTPLEFYYGLNEGYTREFIQEESEQPVWRTFIKYDGEKDDDTALRVFENENGYHIQIKAKHNDKIVIKPEFNIMFPTIPLFIENGKFIIHDHTHMSVPADRVRAEMKKFSFEKKKNGLEKIYTITLDKSALGMSENEPFRLAVYREGKIESTLVKATKYFEPQLIRSYFFPEHYCFFVKK